MSRHANAAALSVAIGEKYPGDKIVEDISCRLQALACGQDDTEDAFCVYQWFVLYRADTPGLAQMWLDSWGREVATGGMAVWEEAKGQTFQEYVKGLED